MLKVRPRSLKCLFNASCQRYNVHVFLILNNAKTLVVLVPVQSSAQTECKISQGTAYRSRRARPPATVP
jgi:hypothetical protein